MQNPSNTERIENNRILSDNKIYKVCDYLYKSITPLFREIIILNLMSIYGGQLKNVLPTLNSLTELSNLKNDVVINRTIENSNQDTIIIAAWGEPPDFSIPDECSITKQQLRTYYTSIIQKILNYLQDKVVYRVGDISSPGYPRHDSD